MRTAMLLGIVMITVHGGCATRGRSRGPTPRPADHRKPECFSLLGKKLYAKASGAEMPKLEADLAEARRRLAEQPDDPERIVWVGRRLGYLWRMRAAIDVYTSGIERFPDYAPLYRHRGHRYISVRRFDDAITDLQRAAELIEGKPDETEPDGMPNAKNIFLTTTAFNVWYHLGLARYLKGDFEGALPAYRETMIYSQRYDDNLVATTYWTYLTLRRLDRDEEAAALLEPIHDEMDIIENETYHRLLMLYKAGVPSIEDPRIESTLDGLLDDQHSNSLAWMTGMYGLGCAMLIEGADGDARAWFNLATFAQFNRTGWLPWPAFGYIAAEAELARMGE